MLASSKARLIESYNLLKSLLQQFTATLDPHLDQQSLTALGVDVSTLDLAQSIDYKDTYFLPMTPADLKALDKRPHLDLCWHFPPKKWCRITDCIKIDHAIDTQITRCKDEDDSFQAYKLRPWRLRGLTGSYERWLFEERFPDAGTDPTKQHRWFLSSVSEAEGHPHQICFSCHQIDNVTGLIRSEMMTLTSLMIAKMRRTCHDLQETYPVLMLSIIGRKARIIQAHMCPIEQRLKVRCSQFFSFDPSTQETMDLIVRWVLSTPLANPQLDPETSDEETQSDPHDTGPQVKAVALPISLKSRSLAKDIILDRPQFPLPCGVAAA